MATELGGFLETSRIERQTFEFDSRQSLAKPGEDVDVESVRGVFEEILDWFDGLDSDYTLSEFELQATIVVARDLDDED